MAMVLCMQFDLKTTAVFLRMECILNNTVKEKRQTYVVLLDLVLKARGISPKFTWAGGRNHELIVLSTQLGNTYCGIFIVTNF